MSNYFDNQSRWSWTVTDNSISVTTDHGDHTHTLDLNKVTFGDMLERSGQVMGDAHRAAGHDYKQDSKASTKGRGNLTELFCLL